MKAEAFEYKGLTLKPIGNILGGFQAKSRAMTTAAVLEPEGYSHKDLYKIAKKHHASVDVFEIDGKLYIPAGTRLVGVLPNTPIKKIEEYERWYN